MHLMSRFVILASLLAVTACQTVAGAGEDLQAAGTAISREARQASR